MSMILETIGASAHSEYGVVTLLLTDGTPGLHAGRLLVLKKVRSSASSFILFCG
jgi:isopenicillin N synthase-like dioxygenase